MFENVNYIFLIWIDSGVSLEFKAPSYGNYFAMIQ